MEEVYPLGGTVFGVDVEMQDMVETCPDCAGDGRWEVRPMGQRHFTYQIPCPTCGRDAWGDQMGSGVIHKSVVVGRVRQLTIHRVIHERNVDGPSRREYMALETGHPSGRVWYHENLFPTSGEAGRALIAVTGERQAAQDEAELRSLDRNRRHRQGLLTQDLANKRARVRTARRLLALAEADLARQLAGQEESKHGSEQATTDNDREDA